MRTYFNNAIFLLGESRREVPKIFFLFVLISILDLVGIGIIGPFLGLVFGGVDNLPTELTSALSLTDYNHTDLVKLMAIAMVAIYTTKSVFGALIMRAVIGFSQNQQVYIRKKLISCYQDMAYSKLIQRNSSEYINAIQLMVPNYANLVMFSLQALGDIIVAIMIIAFLAWTNPYEFGFLVAVTGIFLLGFDMFFRNRMTDSGRYANETSASIVRYTHESLRGFKEIRVLKQEDYFKKNLVHKAEVFANSQIVINFFSMLPKYIFEIVIIVFIAGISVAASFRVEDPVTLVPTLGVFGMASIRMMPLARNFSFTLNRIRYTKDTVMKLAADLRDYDNGNQNLLREKSIAPVPIINHVNSIKLENVSYIYPTSVSPALDNISIEIEAGEHIGIVGSSGAGKTTLVDTLLGLLPPSEGRILINGHNITEHPESLWQHVAYLPQDIFIIDGSVQQNIALGVPDEEIDYDQLTYAISQAQMHDVISNLPNGLKTSLGENGVNLSGGQRQRIALARAFYFKRQILVLDEATSSLDVKAETQVINYLKSLKNKITVISITHRANSLQHCNRILTIAQGRITS